MSVRCALDEEWEANQVTFWSNAFDVVDLDPCLVFAAFGCFVDLEVVLEVCEMQYKILNVFESKTILCVWRKYSQTSSVSAGNFKSTIHVLIFGNSIPSSVAHLSFFAIIVGSLTS